ncbi:MAG: hypothetical protein JO314_09850, partial [Acidobacteria bacterium]|nr:hypothetical protein [Acidobacteriota bacterium]
MRPHGFKTGSLILALIGCGLTAIDSPAQRSHGRASSRSESAVEQVLPSPEGQYVPRPWEPTSAVPDFNHLFIPSPSLSSSAWTSIGPGPLNAGGTNGNVSGRIAGIAADPTDANTIYVATA